MRLAMAAALLLPATAWGQTTLNSQFDFELLRPAPGPFSLVVTERPRVYGDLSFSVGVLGGYADEPLVACAEGDCQDTTYGAVIKSRATGWALASLGYRFLEVGLAIPFTFVNDSDFQEPQGMELGAGGVGDIRASAKVALLGSHRKVGLGVLGAVAIPSGKSSDALGGPGAAFEGWLLADVQLGPVVVAASGGYRYRTDSTTLENLTIQNAFLFAGGVQVDVIRRKLAVIGDFHGSVGVGDEAMSSAESPMEAIGALRFHPLPFLSLTAGAGAGIGSGFGAPAWRAFAGAAFERLHPDSDGDGVADARDRCVDVAEDQDGFSDADGCPDPDNDEDGFADASDKCPNEAEDKDGFQDRDGCPDPDNDRDGVLDLADRCPDKAEDRDRQEDDDGCPDPDDDSDGVVENDKCPKEAEDKDGFQDEDGCPELDNDQDGLADLLDKCPLEAEDKDSFEDDDGCPDVDNDKDGIADAADKCPNEAETINNNEDDDGCPDKGKVLVNVTSEKVEIKETIYFDFRKATIKPRSFKLLAQVATVLRLNANIRVRIEGNTDDVGGEDFNLQLSRERAEAVKAHLIGKHGIDASRLETVGYGKSRPVATGNDEKARAANRRVEFVIIDSQPTAP